MAKQEDTEPDFGADTPVPPGKALTKRSVRAAVNMAISGAPYDEIARVLKYTSAANARAAVERGLAEAYEAKDTASLRRLTSARLEALFRLAYKRAEQETITRWDGDDNPTEIANPEQAAFIRLAMDVSARYAKLHGLDAPTQVQVSPNAEEFEKAIGALVAANQHGLPAEADIFAEGEEVIDVDVIEPSEVDR